MAMWNVKIASNIDSTGNHDSLNVNDSILVYDQNFLTRPPSPTLEQALLTLIPNIHSNTIEHQRTEDTTEASNPLNILSRVTIAIGKYPTDAILHSYRDLQAWMYVHTNKYPCVDICQSINRMYLIHPDHFNSDILFNLNLICAEAYQTIGQVDQAYCHYNQAELIAKNLYDTAIIFNTNDTMEQNRKEKKLEEIGMKLKFQSKFKCNLIKSRKQQNFNSTCVDFFKQLNLHNLTPEECPYIWRQIVLQLVLNPYIAISGGQWLFSYANQLPFNTLQHANSLYVALNLFLFGYGTRIFQEDLNINVFKILDHISHCFYQYGDQSKQFSPIHKMAHVWGTAAIAFYFISDKYKYLICASIIRVSFEYLGIHFLSSGIESLYILAYKHVPEFFNMMMNDPNIKLTLPECINYFRRQLENTMNCIQYSTEIVNQFTLDVFNIDQTDYRI